MTAQAMDALDIANERRWAAARFKRQIAAMPYTDGCEALAAELREEEWTEGVGSIKLDAFLRSVRRLGEAKVPMVLRAANILTHRCYTRIDELTDRERENLADVLESWGGRR